MAPSAGSFRPAADEARNDSVETLNDEPAPQSGCRRAVLPQPKLPGVPTGTCIPSQLHGSNDRHAMSAHCCSGVNGLGPAHAGVSGVPQIGSADAGGGPAKLAAPGESALAPAKAVT